MSPLELVAILALTGYAIYTQTKVTEITGGPRSQFRLAAIYTIIGLAVGGFNLPSGAAGWGLLVLSLALSAGVGLARGYRTDIWRDGDGHVFRKGNATTITLFVLLVVSKFAMGTVAYVQHIDDGQGFGIIMVMIAIMVVFQAVIMQRRAQVLQASPAAADRQRV